MGEQPHLFTTFCRIKIYPRERENAGLNVTCASRVFLVESVVHHAFEIQGKSNYTVTRY